MSGLLALCLTIIGATAMIGTADETITLTITPTSTVSFTAKDTQGTGDATYDFGSTALASSTASSDNEFAVNNTGTGPINVDISAGNTGDWTYNTYASIGTDIYSANFSDDAFSTSTNIAVAGSDLTNSLNPSSGYGFDIKIWTPTATENVLAEQTITLTFTAEASS